MPSISSLKGAGWLFIVAWFVHTADHMRRGTSLTEDGVVWAGTFAAVLATVALTLIFTDHPFAAMASAAIFGAKAVGVSAVHLLPGWGYFSEPLLVGSATDAWAAVLAVPEIAAAAWLAWVGWNHARIAGYSPSAP